MNGVITLPILESRFKRATGDRDWHTNFRVPKSIDVESYSWTMTTDGNGDWRFAVYAIKFNDYGPDVEVSFDLKDVGEIPYKGDGSKLKMYLTVAARP